jgi:hypothetical protein
MFSVSELWVLDNRFTLPDSAAVLQQGEYERNCVLLRQSIASDCSNFHRVALVSCPTPQEGKVGMLFIAMLFKQKSTVAVCDSWHL